MNSEEIKEIGQMFLNISKQKNESPGLTADEKDFIEEFRKNVHALQEAFATNAIPRLKKLEEAVRARAGFPEKVESELKDLRNNSRLKGEGFEKLKTRIESSLLDPFDKMKEEVLNLQRLATKTQEELLKSEQGTDLRVHVLDEGIKKLNRELHRVECKLLPAPDEYLLDKVKELTAKVGKFGNQVGGYGGLISNLQKRDGERTAELNKIRKDYRELQDEMWERFKLVEAWIETKDSADKERIRMEILENGHTDKSEQKKQNKLSDVLAKTHQERQEAREKLDAANEQPISGTKKAALEVLQRKADNEKPKNKWLNWETSTSLAWGKTPISKLDLSVRAHNALIEGGYHYIGSLLTESPYDLIHIKNFGRKSLRETMRALEDKNLVLNMQKFNAQKDERNSKENTQRGNLYGIKV
tara:strand:+ start:244 stop:1488 length:1245 start_codon:yes stop_codon:yes gene_type:complete